MVPQRDTTKMFAKILRFVAESLEIKGKNDKPRLGQDGGKCSLKSNFCYSLVKNLLLEEHGRKHVITSEASKKPPSANKLAEEKNHSASNGSITWKSKEPQCFSGVEFHRSLKGPSDPIASACSGKFLGVVSVASEGKRCAAVVRKSVEEEREQQQQAQIGYTGIRK